MKAVLASNNPNKLREMAQILGPQGWELLTLRDLGLQADPEETGNTFEENALIKARAVMKKTNLPAIADDSGIQVDALRGAPGVHSARYGGESCPDDKARNDLLLKNMKNIPEGQRSARFVSVIALALPEGKELTARGELEGEILFRPRGDGGFGYDPLFYIPSEGCTMAELSPERKNQISHRAKALLEFQEKWKERKIC